MLCQVKYVFQISLSNYHICLRKKQITNDQMIAAIDEYHNNTKTGYHGIK